MARAGTDGYWPGSRGRTLPTGRAVVIGWQTDDADETSTGLPAPAGTGSSDQPTDTVEISPQGAAAAKRIEDSKAAAAATAYAQLSDDEKKQVDDLRKRDTEVRAHEAAHKAAGGQYAGDVSFSFQTGPDGQRYAVGGEVPIDLSPVADDPQATIMKMQQVRAAALAPASPSTADQQVAARAEQIAQEARATLASGGVKPAGQDGNDSQDGDSDEQGIAASSNGAEGAGSASSSSSSSRLDTYA
jgi:hypothetical protein